MSFWIGILILISSCFGLSEAFVAGYYKTLVVVPGELSSTSLTAKKVRRKRKEGEVDKGVASSDRNSAFEFDDLPDYDLEFEATEDNAQKSPLKVTPLASDPLNSRRGSVAPLTSIKDLLNDRSLEAQLNFDEPIDAEPLPSFSDYLKTSEVKTEPTATDKKSRKQERRDAAIAASNRVVEDNGFLSNFAFFGVDNKNENDENKEFNLVKILESGTWACIYILIAWEVYLNSPFFERAAPMAPLVYDSIPGI